MVFLLRAPAQCRLMEAKIGFSQWKQPYFQASCWLRGCSTGVKISKGHTDLLGEFEAGFRVKIDETDNAIAAQANMQSYQLEQLHA